MRVIKVTIDSTGRNWVVLCPKNKEILIHETVKEAYAKNEYRVKGMLGVMQNSGWLELPKGKTGYNIPATYRIYQAVRAINQFGDRKGTINVTELTDAGVVVVLEQSL